MREFSFYLKCGNAFVAGWLCREPSVRIAVQHLEWAGGIISMDLTVTAETLDDAGRLIFDSLNACWQEDCPKLAKVAGHPYELRLPYADQVAALRGHWPEGAVAI